MPQEAMAAGARAMGLDFGAARTGVAVSDGSGTVVRPLAAVERANSSAGLDTIAAMVTELGVDRVVVGLPLGLDGSESTQAARVRSFVDRLRRVVAVPVVLHDERFTTRMADATARATGSEASRDSLAACHLLESYLGGQTS